RRVAIHDGLDVLGIDVGAHDADGRVASAVHPKEGQWDRTRPGQRAARIRGESRSSRETVQMISPSSFTSRKWISGLYWKTIGRRGSSPNSASRTSGRRRARRRSATLTGDSAAMPISMSVAPYPE